MNKTLTHLSLRAATLLTLMLLTILAAPNEARAVITLKVYTNGVESDTGGSIEFKSDDTKYLKVTPNDNYIIQKVVETYVYLGETYNINLEEEVIVNHGEAQEYYPIGLPTGVTDATVTAYFYSNPLAKVTLIASPSSPVAGGELEFDTPDNPTHLLVYPNPGFYLKSVNLSAGGMATNLDPAPVPADADNQIPYYEINITQECTVTASFHEWTDDVRVKFDKNEHGTATTYQDLHLGDKVSKPADPTADYWDFVGWSKDEDVFDPYDFNTVLSKDNLKYSLFNDRYNLTIYAIWTKKNGCTLAFNGNGGTGEITSITQDPGTTYTIPECYFTKDGFDFYGWAKSSGGNAKFFPGDVITLRKDMTLYAVWIKISDLFGGIKWTISKSTGSDKYDVLTLSGSGAMEKKSVSEYPWYKYRDILKTIIIEDGVTTIGNNAFMDYTGITTLSIGSGVKTIGTCAFAGLPNVKNLVSPDNVSSIGIGAFKDNTGITTLSIGSGVKTIDKEAFMGLKNLTSDIILPATLNKINNHAFDNISAETAAGISISTAENCKLKDIYSYAFTHANACIDLSNCTSLTSLGFPVIFKYVTKDVTLPSCVTNIRKNVFSNKDNTFGGDHAYIVVPAGSVLSVGKVEGVIADNGKADLIPYLYDDPTNKISSKQLVLAMSKLSDWQGQTKNIALKRTFPKGKKQTVCLPFVPTELLNHGKVWQFTGISDLGGGVKKAVMTEVTSGPLSANTPYIFEATSDVWSMTFGGSEVNISEYPETVDATAGFTFHGTYEKKHWDANDDDVKNGHIYGFLMEDSEDDPTRKEGMFVKAKYNTNVRPFSCYLEYNGELTGTETTARRKASAEELPDVIEIEWKSAEEAPGEATGIDELRIKNQELRDEGWFSLDGRRLSGRPTAKGLYIHNGKLVIKN